MFQACVGYGKPSNKVVLSPQFNSQLDTISKSAPILSRFSADVARIGGRLLSVYVPNPWQVVPPDCILGRYYFSIADGAILPARTGIQERPAETAERHGIVLLDPTEPMLQYSSSAGSGPPLYLRYDCHWSEARRQFMAEFLADWYRHESLKQRVSQTLRRDQLGIYIMPMKYRRA